MSQRWAGNSFPGIREGFAGGPECILGTENTETQVDSKK